MTSENNGPGSRWIGLALAVVAVLVATWPWLWPGQAVFPWNDALVTALAMQHLQGVWFSDGSWTQGPVGWPLEGSVTQVDWLGGPAVLGLPAHWMGLDPLDVYALVVALGLVLTTWACHRLAQALLGPGPHTWVAAIGGGLHPLALAHGSYANLVHHEMMVLAALGLAAGLEMRRPRWAAAGGLALGLAPQFGFYVGAHAALVGVVVLGCALAFRRGDARSWLSVLGGLGLGAVLIWPVARLYGEFSDRHGIRPDLMKLAHESWDISRPLQLTFGETPASFAQVSGMQKAMGPLEAVPAGAWSVLLILALVGLLRLRRVPGPRWAWVATVVTAGLSALLAVGPEWLWNGQQTGIVAPGRLLMWVPGLDNLRSPVRWLTVTATALGVLAAAGAYALSQMAAGWGRVGGVSVPVILVLMIGVGVRPVFSEPRSFVDLDPAYEMIDSLPGEGAIVDLLSSRGGCSCSLGHRTRAAMFHQRPLVGGLHARRVSALVELNRRLITWPSPQAVQMLRFLGVSAVFEHVVRGPVDETLATCTEADGHRLCALVDDKIRALPHPESVQPALAGDPVVAVHWADEPVPSRRFALTCGGQTVSVDSKPWHTLTALRYGSTGPQLELVLAEPCEESVSVTKGNPSMMTVRDHAQLWPEY